jgi:hypothetical protein
MKYAERSVLHRWTRHQYGRLIDHGFLDEDDPIELLDGLLLVKEPQHSPHRTAAGETRPGPAALGLCGDRDARGRRHHCAARRAVRDHPRRRPPAVGCRHGPVPDLRPPADLRLAFSLR